MRALSLGRACNPGHFCRRTALPLPPGPPPSLLPALRGRTLAGGRVTRANAGSTRSAQMAGAQLSEDQAKVVRLRAVEATPESFAPFGQVVAASPDGDQFGPQDAQLDLSRGIPRFYIMSLEDRPLQFSSITHHASVTQCLGSIGGHDWYLGVARPSIVETPPEQSGHDGRKPLQSRAGHCYLPPDPAEVCVFRVSGPKFLKLHKGTWHAGPLFKADAMDFYNLELSNTNVVDHTTHDFKKEDGVTFVVED